MTNNTAEKQITAKFSGKCTSCGDVIPSGTQCMWAVGAGVRHLNCASNGASTHINTVGGTSFNNAKSVVTVTMGVFKKDGKIYVVKPNKDKTRVYAKEIVESPERMTENGAVVDFETVYRPGVVFSLTESDRWDLADAKDFLTKFARCIVCGRSLKAAKSVAASIGPVCAKYFAHHGDSSTCHHNKPTAKLVDYQTAADHAIGNEHDDEQHMLREREVERALEERAYLDAEERADRYDNELVYGDA
jgi:hypothetical protein